MATLTATVTHLTATRHPMRADGNADGNGDASDGNGRIRRDEDREQRGQRTARRERER